jgi:anti-sigma factor RsiW
VDCAGCRPELAALVEGRLDDAEAGVVREHVASCTACAQLLELEEALRRTVREAHGARPGGPDAHAEARAAVSARRSAALGWMAAVVLGVALLAALAFPGATDDAAAPLPTNPTQVRGVLTCVRCAVASRVTRDAVTRTLLPEVLEGVTPPHPPSPLALRDEHGRTWQLVAGPDLAEVLSDHAKVGRTATVFGAVEPDLGAILVVRSTVD